MVRGGGLTLFRVGEAGKDIRLAARRAGLLGQELEIEYGGERHQVALPLIGAYQAANALVAAGLAIATGSAPAQVFDALARLQPVRGRLERAAITAAGAPVYVDYAHTPDALAAAIAALRPHVGEGGRLIAVVRRRWRPRSGQARADGRGRRGRGGPGDRHRRQSAR